MGVAPSDLAVIVTGGARGLGRAMALGLAKAGMRVAVADLPSSQVAIRELIDLARTQHAQERIHPIDCDVTRWEACSAAVEAAVERFGGVHGLVNNAGVGMQDIGNVLVGARKKFYEVDAGTWRNAIDVNFNGPFMMAKAIAPGGDRARQRASRPRQRRAHQRLHGGGNSRHPAAGRALLRDSRGDRGPSRRGRRAARARRGVSRAHLAVPLLAADRPAR